MALRKLRMGREHLVDVDAVFAQGVAEANAVAIGQVADALRLKGSRGGRRSQQAAPEAAFLVRPVDKVDRDGRSTLLDLATQHGQSRDATEAAVEPAAVGDRIEMAADDER